MKSSELKDFIHEFYKKNPWIESRLWDDKCICKDEEHINPSCPNERCKDMRK